MFFAKEETADQMNPLSRTLIPWSLGTCILDLLVIWVIAFVGMDSGMCSTSTIVRVYMAQLGISLSKKEIMSKSAFLDRMNSFLS